MSSRRASTQLYLLTGCGSLLDIVLCNKNLTEQASYTSIYQARRPASPTSLRPSSPALSASSRAPSTRQNTWLEHGSKIYGAELGAMYSGVEVPATSTPPMIPCNARPDTSAPRSVAPRRVTSASELMAPTPGSKDEFKSPRGPNVNFLQKRAKL